MSVQGTALPDAPEDAAPPDAAETSATGRTSPHPIVYLLMACAMLGAGVLAGRGMARLRTSPVDSPSGAAATPPVPVSGAADGPVVMPGVGAAAPPVPDSGGLSVGLVEPGMASLGEFAPAFSLARPASDDMVVLSGHAGKPVLLNFWATWCVPCRHEMPFLQAVHDAHADTGDLAVIAIDVEETAEAVAAYLSDLGLSFPVGLDSDGAVASQYRIGLYPTTYLIGSDGRIMSIKKGAYANQFEVEQAASLMLRP